MSAFRYLTYLLITCISIFWLATIRNVTSWGDDWGAYVHQAKNLIEGKPYADILFIKNPDTLTPALYPPGFSILLLPIYWIYGINTLALKIPGIICFILSLFVTVIYIRRKFSPVIVFLILFFVGMNPYYWDFKDLIYPDFPSLLFIMLSAWLIDKYYISDVGRLKHCILLGLVIYLSYSIRQLGGLFIVALFVFDILKRKAISKKFLVVTATFMLSALIQQLLLPGDTGYLEIVRHEYHDKNTIWTLHSLLSKLTRYSWGLSDFWLMCHGARKWMWEGKIFSDIFLVFIFLGYSRQVTKRFTPVEVFVILFAIFTVLYPGYQGARYFIPLFPFFFIYCFSSFDIIKISAFRYFLISLFSVPALIFYISAYKSNGLKHLTYEFQEKPAQQMFAYIREHTPENAVFVLDKARILSLYTNRRAAKYHDPDNKNEVISFMRSIGVDYVITGVFDEGYFPAWVQNNPADFKQIYETDYLKLYKTQF